VETWREVRVAGTWSTSFAVASANAGVNDRLTQFAGQLPAPVVVTSLVLQLLERDQLCSTLVLRISGPGAAPDRITVSDVLSRAREAGLTLQRLDGEQGALLRYTTPVAVQVGR
jgi:hypothetical protein